MRRTKAVVMALGVVLATTLARGAGPYDGTYAGISISSRAANTGDKGNSCIITAKVPGPLTVANGHASTPWSGGTLLEGEVEPGGKLILRSSRAGRFEGQIDATGLVKGYYMSSCILDIVWKRKG
jgi:hypothetical protein